MGLYAELQNIPEVASSVFFPFPLLYFLGFWYSLYDLAIYKDLERSVRLEVSAFSEEQEALMVKSWNSMKKNAGELGLKFFC